MPGPRWAPPRPEEAELPDTLPREATSAAHADLRLHHAPVAGRPRHLAARAGRPPQRDPRAWARTVWFAAAIAVTVASLVNLVIAVMARHDGIVRGAFRLGTVIGSYRLHQLTYHLGQLHRAMAMAGSAWFVIAIAAGGWDTAARAAGVAILAILMAMMWTARDGARHTSHNRFEAVHRYGGWASLAVLTELVLRQAASASGSTTGLLAQPSVLLLAVLVALVVHPWLGVRRLPVQVLRVTDHVVILALAGRGSVGEFVRVSREGREWHSFAVATTGAEGPDRYCLVVRRAGDWTERLARDAECGRPPSHLLVRRMRGRGFMYHAQAYRRVLIVATGAGIGPVLPYLLGASPVAFECLWIGRDHRAAVGRDLVRRAQASGTVTLIDSSSGRPDVGSRVAALAPQYEAVFVVGNAQVRDEVACVCEDLRVPWYGPTFDS
jgi:hypothetical protein